MSRVRRYSRSGPTAQHPRSPTGLSPPAVTRSSGLRLKDAKAARALPPPPAHSSNPPQASPAGCTARGVWAPPRSLAATEGILSVPRGTEMFQFPRCPPEGKPPGARPCAGRVAPFGHPRIAGCQRLPGAFRRVAASFLGRQRQGIHHAPFMRIPDSVHIQQTSWPRHQTGTRQRDVSLPAASLPDAVPERRSDEPGRILRPARHQRWQSGSQCRTYLCSSLMFLCSARGRPDTSTPLRSRCRDQKQGSVIRPPKGSSVPAAAEPAGSAWRIVKVQARSSDLCRNP